MLNNDYKYYSPDEIFWIFDEQHRLCSPLNPMAGASFRLEKSTLITDWQDARDLLTWRELAPYLNNEFKSAIPIEEWKAIMTPRAKKTLWDLCLLLSSYAQKEVVKPIAILGTTCYSAAVFLTLKKNLQAKGVDVTELRPSTLLAPFLEKNFLAMMEEVTAIGVRTLEKIEYGEILSKRKYRRWPDGLLPRCFYQRPLKTGDVQTFRDLVNKIVKNERSE